ncbi:MAG: HIT domain-containing protein [Planctomycetaceae bacterium]|nr:HIT domain-containing protein [Planctomycetaceae bacterium]
MSHETLWAPWRLNYIVNAADKNAIDTPQPGCFLCRYRDDTHDAENYVVDRSEHSLIVLNRFPYNNGHLLIAPREHKATLEELSDAELLDLQQQVRRMVKLLKLVMGAEGFNIGLNLGRVAGAGLPGHLHWHIVPRWNGDVNFMPIVADTKVIPQSLDSLYQLLRADLATVAQ